MKTSIRRHVKKPILAAAAVALPFLAVPDSAQACSGEPMLGTLCVVGFNFCPRGFREANGDLLPIASNEALFSLLGTQYGGDGRTTFALPDLRGRVMVGIGQGPGLSPVFQGGKRGAERHTITVMEMPSHTHSAQATFTPSGGSEFMASAADGERAAAQAGDYLGKANAPTLGGADVNVYTGTEFSPAPLSGATGGGGTVEVRNMNTGGSQPLDVIDPGLGLKVCIAMVGLYPSRN